MQGYVVTDVCPEGFTVKKRKSGRNHRDRFSAVLAVKENARTRVGQPPPARVLSSKVSARAAEKHKPSLAERLDSGADGRED